MHHIISNDFFSDLIAYLHTNSSHGVKVILWNIFQGKAALYKGKNMVHK